MLKTEGGRSKCIPRVRDRSGVWVIASSDRFAAIWRAFVGSVSAHHRAERSRGVGCRSWSIIAQKLAGGTATGPWDGRQQERTGELAWHCAPAPSPIRACVAEAAADTGVANAAEAVEEDAAAATLELVAAAAACRAAGLFVPSARKACAW